MKRHRSVVGSAASVEAKRSVIALPAAILGITFVASGVSCADQLPPCKVWFQKAQVETHVAVDVHLRANDGTDLAEKGSVRLALPNDPESKPICEVERERDAFRAILPTGSVLRIVGAVPGYAPATYDVVTSQDTDILLTLLSETNVNVTFEGCSGESLVVMDQAGVSHRASMHGCTAALEKVAVGELEVWQAMEGGVTIGSPHKVVIGDGIQSVKVVAWNTKVRGRVICEGRPVANAKILLRSISDLADDIIGQTDDQGKFILSEVKPGLWQAIVLEKTRTAKVEVVVPENGDIFLPIEAERPFRP